MTNIHLPVTLVITDQQLSIFRVTKNTSKFEQLQQRRPERSLAHEDFVRLSFAKPIGKLRYRDIEKKQTRNVAEI